MAGLSFSRILNPWKYRREQRAAQIAALRQRDGDACRRCRRPIRFDLTHGQDLAPQIEPIACAGQAAEAEAFANLCLTHARCHASGQNHTGAVAERLRPRREADLFAKAREKRAEASGSAQPARDAA